MALVRTRTVPEPSPENKERVDRRVNLAIPFFRAALWPRHRVTVAGRENVPREGPVLVLSNHVASLDPITLILASDRQIHFMATRSLMQEPGISRIMQFAAVVPRSKFVADMSSVRKLKAWRDLEAAVGLFPEGERTWDGRPLPMVRSIEKLVRLMRAPVVTARIINAYRQAPRWGVKMRTSRVHVEFDPPKVFARRAPMSEIRAYVEERIRVPAVLGADWSVKGSGLALGAENVLYACPLCFTIDGLQPAGDRLTCRSCGAGWRMDVHHKLHPTAGDAPLALHDAVDRVREHLSQQWIADIAVYERDGIVLESAPMQLTSLGDVNPVIAEGRLRLTEDALTVVDPQGADRWRVALPDLLTATVDMRRRLQFHTREGPVEAVMPEESVIKWDHWVNHWRTRKEA